MRCYFYDSIFGEFICFIGDRFHEHNLNIGIEESSSASAVVILFEEENLVRIVESYKKFFGKVDICFAGCVSSYMVQQLNQLMKEKKVRKCIVSSLNIYDVLPYEYFYVGSEMWDRCGEETGLISLDAGEYTIKEVNKLILSKDLVVEYILSFDPENDLEIILLLDIWFQKNIQYIKGKTSKSEEGIYICKDINRESKIEDVLLNHFGRCEDIAFTAALILNDPRLHISCRQVSAVKINGFNHSWNMITYEDKEYYTDFTHNITRNPDKIHGALKARSYSMKYTMVGKEEFPEKYGFPVLYSSSDISLKSVDRNYIFKTILKLKRKGVELSWADKLAYESYMIKSV